jgi:hypothetical protein
MLNILGYDGTTVAQLQPNEVAGWLQQAGARLWLKATAPSAEETAWLKATFSLPPAAAEGLPTTAATLNPTPRFINGHLPLLSGHNLTFTLGSHFLFTVQKEAEVLRPLTDLWQMYQQDLSRWPYGLDYLLYQLLQALMTIPPVEWQNSYAALKQSPTVTPPFPLTETAHQLHTWHYFLQQWHSLTGQLAQLEHPVLDSNTRHQFQQLQHQLATQSDEVTLLQNWLGQHQQQQQAEQSQQTLTSQQRLFWLAAAILIVLIIQLVAQLFVH